jgi:hypothetical protein
MKRQIFLAIVICFAFSCKKNKEDKKPSCRLKSVTEVRTTGNSTWDFTYNNEGKISVIKLTHSGGTTIKEFTYTGSTIIAIATTSTGFLRKDSITLNANGRPTNVRVYYNEAGTSWENTAYEYNGNEISKHQKSSSAAPSPTTLTATYANGNMIKLGNNNYEFYNDKNQAGDFLNTLGIVEYGLSLYSNQNLTKSITNGSSVSTIVYEKNADDLIIKTDFANSAGSFTWTYQYECN